jgi:hypothetical protein
MSTLIELASPLVRLLVTSCTLRDREGIRIREILQQT